MERGWSINRSVTLRSGGFNRLTVAVNIIDVEAMSAEDLSFVRDLLARVRDYDPGPEAT